ncbi:MAG: hypothetical protein IJ523_12775 [Succinivibrionaceae bacterium]|nr:hypothetical protein [Succinivibrionaceae bacterium]
MAYGKLNLTESAARLEELKEAAMRVFPADEPEMVRRDRVFRAMQGVISAHWVGWRIEKNRDKDGCVLHGNGIQSISVYCQKKLAGFRLVDEKAAAVTLLCDIVRTFSAARERMAAVK